MTMLNHSMLRDFTQVQIEGGPPFDAVELKIDYDLRTIVSEEPWRWGTSPNYPDGTYRNTHVAHTRVIFVLKDNSKKRWRLEVVPDFYTSKDGVLFIPQANVVSFDTAPPA